MNLFCSKYQKTNILLNISEDWEKFEKYLYEDHLKNIEEFLQF